MNIHRLYYTHTSEFNGIPSGGRRVHMDLPDTQGVLKEQGRPLAPVKLTYCVERPGIGYIESYDSEATWSNRKWGN